VIFAMKDLSGISKPRKRKMDGLMLGQPTDRPAYFAALAASKKRDLAGRH
jgi:hypothetical protein